MPTSKYEWALDILNRHRAKNFCTSEKGLFESRLVQRGWRIEGNFTKIIDILYGIDKADIEGKGRIFILYDSIFNDRSVPTAWFHKTGEHTFPFAGDDLVVFYISDNGYIYGDARDGKAMYHYGYLEEDGLYNAIMRDRVRWETFDFDENLYDDLYFINDD